MTGGKTNDCRNVEELAAAAGDPEAQLAFDMFVYKIAAKAAEMATSMCGMDTLVFTAGIGEHAPAVRAGVADRLAFMGVKMDHARNALRGDGAWCLSAKDSKVKIFVIPTDEEFMIASDVERIVNGKIARGEGLDDRAPFGPSFALVGRYADIYLSRYDNFFLKCGRLKGPASTVLHCEGVS